MLQEGNKMTTEYAKNVYRVAKIEKTPDRYKITISVSGIEYPEIGTIYAKRMEKTTMVDYDRDRIQHGLHVWDESGMYELFAFDIIIAPEGLFKLDKIQNAPNGKIESYVLA